jgi:EAL domain-containing protein (putative c-di-GMP-specific phosphodiesterase class I)
MAELRKLGFVLSIDDFGAGYSSLNILKDVSSDVLKLDRAFFGKEKLQKEEQIILTSIVDMARKLDIKVLSEGVETTEQSQFLKDIQCDLAQGFLYSRPIPLREFEQMLNTDVSFGVF